MSQQQYVFPMDNNDLYSQAAQDPERYLDIVYKIVHAENDAIREMYEIDLFNGWF